MKDKFYLGAFNVYYYNHFHTNPILALYDTLCYKAMLNFCAHTDYYPTEWNNNQYDGGFFEPIAHYRDYINNNIIGTWRTLSGDNSLVTEREKVLRPCFGQRSTYIVTNPGGHSMSEFPAYFYQSSTTGRNFTDNIFAGGASVRRCLVDSDAVGFMIKDLYENCEQINNIDTAAGGADFNASRNLWSDIKSYWYNNRWFIKPRLRIDSTYAKNNPNDTVCVLYVNRFNGQRLDSFLIKCDNFLLHYGNDKYYDGHYLEMFYHLTGHENDNILNAFSVDARALAVGRENKPFDSSHVDYYIKWWGKVDTYLQYLRVDDSWAHYLFTDSLDNNPDNRLWKFHHDIDSEVVAFSNTSGFGYFWVDEVCFNSIPCVEEVNRLVKSYSNNQTSIVTFQSIYDMCQKAGLRHWANETDASTLREALIQNNFTTNLIIHETYPFALLLSYPPNLSIQNPDNYYTTRFLHKSNSANNYNDSVQLAISGDLSIKNDYINLAKSYGLIYNISYQVHSDDGSINLSNGTGWGLREPTNEEIRLQPYLAMAYGVKQLEQYSFYSYIGIKNDIYVYSLGLLDAHPGYVNDSPRYYNYYGQAKWDSVVRLNKKLKAMGNYMYPAGFTSQHLQHNKTICVNTYNSYSNAQHLQYSYLSDITSYYNDPDNPGGDWSDPQTLSTDESSKRYYEIGIYNDPNDNLNKYMLVVNKRCVPVLNGLGDLRTVKFYFTGLNVFNNWVLRDVITGDYVTFDKNSTSGVYFPHTFQPGEGKLFKLSPVMHSGGSFVVDESLGGGANFTCDSTVYNDGHNILIYVGCTIKFNQKGKIVCNGGSFVSGHYPDVPVNQRDIFQGNNSALWEGLSFENCSNVEIGNSDFSDIYYNSYLQNQNTAIDIQDCYNFVINGCNFILNTESSAVDVNISSNAGTRWYNADIYYNNFTFTEHSSCPIYVNSLSSNVIPVNISNNNFVNTNEQPINMAIFVNGLTGGTIRNNIINNFNPAITVSSSTLDLFNNYIYSNVESGVGISAIAGSDLNMNPNAGYFTGGHNQITTANLNCNNINVNNSIFDLQNGSNVFNISSAQNSSYHLYGFFPVDSAIDNVLAENNCFQIDNVYPLYPSEQVTWGENGSPVNFDFDPYSCSNNNFQDYEVFTFSNAYNDTIYKIGTGNGGGASNEELKIKNEELEEQRLDEISEIQGNCKKLRDSVNILIRKRDYVNADLKCRTMLLNYPDSVQTLTAISWIYLATVSRDSLTSRVNMLKTFYESIILNNPNNKALIDRAFYFIQKCKVALKQYQSAMQGFQLIMQQNPYNYEGLVASWDYAATHLLDSLNGHGGAFNDQYSMDNVQIKEQEQNNIIQNSENKFSIFSEIKLNIEIERAMTGIDSSKFSKTNVKQIKNNIKKTIEDSKTKQVKKVEELNSKSKKGDKRATDELKTLKNLNDVIKLKKPKTKIELKKIITNDISKVFGKKVKNASETVKIIPKEFALYQNYPNPFNPTTKINYDLPKDAKVSIVIYDILGREMKRLVNNEFKPAGRYSIEFNGQFLASGVYFYRLVAEKYVQVKKMVLIK